MSDDSDQGQHVLPVPDKVGLLPKIWAAFLKTFPEAVGKQIGVWLIALVGFMAVWLWGWLVGGGLTRAAGAVPAGAIMAFDSKTGCPSGWSPFDQAMGRTIIGADPPDFPSSRAHNTDVHGNQLSPHSLEAWGGAESMKLAPEQLPPQRVKTGEADYGAVRHGNFMAYITGPKTGPDMPEGQRPAYSEETFLPPYDRPDAKPQQPIDIRPPYVALYYCQNTSS